MQKINRDKRGRWKKGESGNPKGRPKNTKYIPEFLREIGEEKTKDGTKFERVMRLVYNLALKGDRWAIEFIANRTEGKPKETIEQRDITGDKIKIL